MDSYDIQESTVDKGVRFTRDPCPECKKSGGATGYEVDADCKQCLGSGRARE